MQESQIDFSNGRTFHNLLASSLPLLVAQILNLLYSVVDRMYVSHMPGIGQTALGGMGLCFPVITIITGFANWFGSGSAPLCSIARGKGDHKHAADILNLCFYMLVGTGLVLTLTGRFGCMQILELFGASGTSLPYAVDYLSIYILGTVPAMISLGMNPLISAQGFATKGMMTVFLGAFLNLVLDPLFIFGLGWGLAGAAWATILSQCASAVYVIWFLRSGKAELRLVSFHKVVWKLRTIWDILSLGFASFVMQATNSLVQVASNSMLGQYGQDIYISIMAVLVSIRQIAEVPVHALTDGSVPLLGYLYGAGKRLDLKLAIRIMCAIGVGYTVLIWALVMGFPTVFMLPFGTDAAFLKLAVPACRIYFGAFLFQSLQFCGQTVFKALNHKKSAIFFSLLRKVVIVVPLTLLLPVWMGTDGVFLAEPVSNVMGGLICFVTMYITVYKKL